MVEQPNSSLSILLVLLLIPQCRLVDVWHSDEAGGKVCVMVEVTPRIQPHTTRFIPLKTNVKITSWAKYLDLKQTPKGIYVTNDIGNYYMRYVSLNCGCDLPIHLHLERYARW